LGGNSQPFGLKICGYKLQYLTVSVDSKGEHVCESQGQVQTRPHGVTDLSLRPQTLHCCLRLLL